MLPWALDLSSNASFKSVTDASSAKSIALQAPVLLHTLLSRYATGAMPLEQGANLKGETVQTPTHLLANLLVLHSTLQW
jgi:hypothetical protein